MNHCPHDEPEPSAEVRAELEQFEPVLMQAYARLQQVDTRPRYTAGRNDPCPCGSGSKFKKCCADTPARDRERRRAENVRFELASKGRQWWRLPHELNHSRVFRA